MWQAKDRFIPNDRVLRDSAILSFTAKTLGEKAVRYMDSRGKADPYDDEDLVHALWWELNDADIVVGQNVQRFDIRKINARFLAYELPPPRPYKVIDTLTESRRIASFWSHKLEWLTEATGVSAKDSHGQFPGFKLWEQVLAGNPKAWEAMRKYNIQDVKATEALYLRLRPYIQGHPNLPLYSDGEGCPRCGSDHISRDGDYVAKTRVYPLYKCLGCGGWSRGTKFIKGRGVELTQ